MSYHSIHSEHSTYTTVEVCRDEFMYPVAYINPDSGEVCEINDIIPGCTTKWATEYIEIRNATGEYIIG